MATPWPGFHSPAAGFEVPLEMLAACHGRIDAQCGTLRRLGPHLATHGADGAAREAAQALMRYFDTAAPDHHADEEQDLFPALLEAMAGSDAVCIRELTAALAQEHRVLERQWQALRAVLLQVTAGDAACWSTEAAEGFIGQYERHIAREDGELLPMAARLLGEAELERIGRAMRLRRDRR
jgi:hemerythrin-like domain-containing protein